MAARGTSHSRWSLPLIGAVVLACGNAHAEGPTAAQHPDHPPATASSVGEVPAPRGRANVDLMTDAKPTRHRVLWGYLGPGLAALVIGGFALPHFVVAVEPDRVCSSSGCAYEKLDPELPALLGITAVGHLALGAAFTIRGAIGERVDLQTMREIEAKRRAPGHHVEWNYVAPGIAGLVIGNGLAPFALSTKKIDVFDCDPTYGPDCVIQRALLVLAGLNLAAGTGFLIRGLVGKRIEEPGKAVTIVPTLGPASVGLSGAF